MNQQFEALLQDVKIDISGTGEHDWNCSQFKALWSVEFEQRNYGIKSMIMSAQSATAIISPLDDDGNEIQPLNIVAGQGGWEVKVDMDYWKVTQSRFILNVTDVEIDIEKKVINLQFVSPL